MKFSDESYNLRIVLDDKQCELSPDEIAKMETGLDALSRVVREFPVRDLYITVQYHPRSRDYHVKTSLVLSGRTLFTGDRDELVYPAYERCVGKLVRKVETYKEHLGEADEISKQRKGTRQDLLPTQTPDAAVLEAAVREGDYVAFRRELDVYEEPVRKRIGRWVQRYPELNEMVDDAFPLSDLVEEVFLNAFEEYDRRPANLRLGDWLENLIDPSIKRLLLHFDEELENISFARTLSETPTQPPDRPG